MLSYRVFFLSLLFVNQNIFAQEKNIHGNILTTTKKPLPNVTISTQDPKIIIAVSDSSGYFLIKKQIPIPTTLIFQHVGYYEKKLFYNGNSPIEVILEEETKILSDVDIESTKERNQTQNFLEINPKMILEIPAPTLDISRLLATLPGVVVTSELSSVYSVRGGSYDENLVYVNDIPVYRPFLVKSGQQEGLSFVNLDMTSSVYFSAGGWQAKYGDKMASVLNVTYKKPTKQSASVSLGLLGSNAYWGGNIKNISILIGFRYKDTRYLLNTLPTQGQYLPRFFDIQSFISLPQKKVNARYRYQLSFLNMYAQNKYFTKPENEAVEFGTFYKQVRFEAGFDGQEILQYETMQNAIKWTNWWDEKHKLEVVFSTTYTEEKENIELESGYRLCDVNKNTADSGFNKCLNTIGLGTQYKHSRNSLKALFINTDTRYSLFWNSQHTSEMGVEFKNEKLDDLIDEYTFQDSADFAKITQKIGSNISLNNFHYTFYIQHNIQLEDHSFHIGIRNSFSTFTNQLLISPRIQYTYNFGNKKSYSIGISTGVYQQPPLYREMRRYDGSINRQIKAQESYHGIINLQKYFKWKNKNFKIITESYCKYLNNLIPYDIENINLRYFGENTATGWAYGVDFRINGEFIAGTDSWLSIGILKTTENLFNDKRGQIRRPTDQRVTVGLFFQDYIPRIPTVKVSLSFLYGTGLPFGPPKNIEYRNSFQGKDYQRLDLGILKIFPLPYPYLKSITISLDILNLIGVNNVISYNWIKDFENNQYAIPNSLSSRFFNFKLSVNF
ncbi:MAG: carboxypeptidase-like regulatory domain-containing protein [Chitinophagaceae bacterium]|nr:carboxypeptidase-like regulatory domain-containing protein [Chitinophagaceae bacterium]